MTARRSVTAVGTEMIGGRDRLGMIATVAASNRLQLNKWVVGVETVDGTVAVPHRELVFTGPTLVDFVPDTTSFALLEGAIALARPSVFDKRGRQFAPESVLDAWHQEVATRAELSIVNHQEASAILGRTVETAGQMKDAVKALVDSGCRSALVTGGHLDGIVRDFCFDGADVYEFGADMVRCSGEIFGAGAAHAAFVLCALSSEMDMLSAIDSARGSVTLAIKNAYEIENGVVVCPTISR